MASRVDARVLLILVTTLTALELTGSSNVEGPWAVSYADLLAHPEANLAYPGSRVLDSGGWCVYVEHCGPCLRLTPGQSPGYVEKQLVVVHILPNHILGVSLNL